MLTYKVLGHVMVDDDQILSQVCDIQVLVGKPKIFFIEACRFSTSRQKYVYGSVSKSGEKRTTSA